jgi:hypothetical protein
MPVFNKPLKTKKGKTSAYLLGGLRGKREKGDHFTLDVVTNSQEEKCRVCNVHSVQ